MLSLHGERATTSQNWDVRHVTRLTFHPVVHCALRLGGKIREGTHCRVQNIGLGGKDPHLPGTRFVTLHTTGRPASRDSRASVAGIAPMPLIVRGTIVNSTYVSHNNLPGIYLPIFANTIWYYLLWSAVIIARNIFPQHLSQLG